MALADRLKTRLAEALPGGRVPLRLDRPVASLCFDDFPRSAWRVGGPILARHGVKASFYVAGSFCGRFAEGNEQFTAADLREVKDAGHEIGCHSFSHRPASGMSAQAFAADLDRNAAFLRDEVGITPQTFAYTYGLFSPTSLAVTRPRFSAARRVRGGVNVGSLDPHRLAAFPLEARNWSEAAFARAVEEIVRRQGWLVLFTHDVSETPTPYGCTPGVLERALEALKRAGVLRLPTAAALSSSSSSLSRSDGEVARRVGGGPAVARKMQPPRWSVSRSAHCASGSFPASPYSLICNGGDGAKTPYNDVPDVGAGPIPSPSS